MPAGQNYVDLEFESINITPVISWYELHQGALGEYPWSIRQSGPHLPDHIATEIERLWRERAGVSPPSTPLEVEPDAQYWEGAVTQVTVTRYERDRNARAACLAHYGYECKVCLNSPALFYGPETADLIEVHHKVPISEIKEGYVPDPINHLIPVYPNCHAMIHRGGITRSVEEVQALILDQDERREAGETEPHAEDHAED